MKYREEAFVAELSRGDMPVVRVLPVSRKLRESSEVLPYNELKSMVEARSYCAVARCPCRQMHAQVGGVCDHFLENCLHFGSMGRYMTVENDQFDCGIWDKKGTCMIPLASLETLPLYHRKTIPSDYQDLMGHMNIRWYFDLFARSGRKFFKSHGLDEDYFKGGEFGIFALKHFIQYFAEVRVEQTVGIHTRLIARSDKRFHFMQFMINKTTTQLAATFEALITHADLKIRRAAPMPARIAQKLDATLADHESLDWEPPISGAIRL